MPTRIVLRDEAEEALAVDQWPRPGRHRRYDVQTPPTNRRPIHHPASLNFRTTLKETETTTYSVSSTDIRASPRLMGYLFTGLAAFVMLISILQFYKKGNDGGRIFRRLDQDDIDQSNYRNFGSIVLRYKLIGAIAISAAGVFINFVILLMHLDTVFFPNIWRKVFCDGSPYERHLIMFLIVFWATGLYFATSSFSVGELQANVYFTSWIAFCTTVINYGIWRHGAGLPSLDSILESQHDTTRNWLYTLIFNAITALSLLDLYVNRSNLKLTIEDGVEVELPQKQWNQFLSTVWISFGACVFVLVFNFYCKTIQCCRVVLNGRYVEGIVLVGMVGIWFWGIVEYTGINSFTNGPGNLYFGIWCTCLCSIMTFGTWLKENSHIVTNRRGDAQPKEDVVGDNRESDGTRSSEE